MSSLPGYTFVGARPSSMPLPRHLRPVHTAPHPPADGPTAVLLFARRAGAEAVAKSALGGRASAAACGVMRDRARSVARASGLPVLEWDERRQRGRTFGARLVHGVEAALARGYEHVIVIGGDCPELKPRDLRAAADALERGSNVLGRDLRGGAFLLGLAGRDFDPERLAGLPWETRRLADAFSIAFATTVELAARRDVNTVADLDDVSRRLSGLRAWSAFLPRPASPRVRGEGIPIRKARFGESRITRGPPVGA